MMSDKLCVRLHQIVIGTGNDFEARTRQALLKVATD